MGGMALAGMLQINTSLVSLDVSDTDQVSEKILWIGNFVEQCCKPFNPCAARPGYIRF